AMQDARTDVATPTRLLVSRPLVFAAPRKKLANVCPALNETNELEVANRLLCDGYEGPDLTYAVMPNGTSSHVDLRDEHDRLTLLLELTNSLVSTLELRDVLRAVMQNARRLMRSDSEVVALPDSEGRDV